MYQWFSENGPQASSIPVTWELAGNAHHWALPQTLWNRSFGWALQVLLWGMVRFRVTAACHGTSVFWPFSECCAGLFQWFSTLCVFTITWRPGLHTGSAGPGWGPRMCILGRSQVRTLALLHTSSVALNRFLSLSVSQLPHLYNEEHNSAYLIGCYEK